MKELKSKLDSALRDLEGLKESRERQKEMVSPTHISLFVCYCCLLLLLLLFQVEALVRQRDMYKLMVAQATPLPQVSW